jgi:hypothetical protein
MSLAGATQPEEGQNVDLLSILSQKYSGSPSVQNLTTGQRPSSLSDLVTQQLAQTPPGQAPMKVERKPTLVDQVRQAANDNPVLRTNNAIMDAGLSILSGFGAMAVSGVETTGLVLNEVMQGIAKDFLQTPRDPDFWRHMTERVEARKEQLTYIPRTPEGKTIVDVVSLPFLITDKLTKGISDVGRKMGLPPEDVGVIAGAVEVLSFYLGDRGIRAAAGKLAGPAARFRKSVTSKMLNDPEVLRHAQELRGVADVEPAIIAKRAQQAELFESQPELFQRSQVESRAPVQAPRAGEQLPLIPDEQIPRSGPEIQPGLFEPREARPVPGAQMPIRGQEVQAGIPNTVETRISLSNIPDYVREAIDRNIAIADNLNLTGEITQLARSGRTAHEISQILHGRFPRNITNSEQRDIIRSVRTGYGIPSVEEMRVLPERLPTAETPLAAGVPGPTPAVRKLIDDSLLGDRNAMRDLKGQARGLTVGGQPLEVGLQTLGANPAEIAELTPKLKGVRARVQPKEKPSAPEATAPARTAEEGRLPATEELSLEQFLKDEAAVGALLDETTPVKKSSARRTRKTPEEQAARLEEVRREEGLPPKATVEEEQIASVANQVDQPDAPAIDPDSIEGRLLTARRRADERVASEQRVVMEYIEEQKRKLNENPLVPDDTLTAEGRAAVIDDAKKPLGLVTIEEIENAMETGNKAILERVPGEIADTLDDAISKGRKTLESTERRRFSDILADIRTLITDESGQVSFLGNEGLSSSQKQAAQRLQADAQRLGVEVTELMKSLGFGDAENYLYSSYLAGLSNPVPPPVVQPRGMTLDPQAVARGDKVVVQNKNGSLNKAPIYNTERSVLQQAKDIKQSFFPFLESPLRLFEEAGLKELIYYPYRSAERAYRTARQALTQELYALSKNLTREQREAITAHAYSLDPAGQKINQFNNKAPRALTDNEKVVYDTLRNAYDELFKRINEVRKAIGQEPLDKIPNYFTFVRAFSMAEELGLAPNPLLSPKNVVAATYAKYSSVPFAHAKKRTGAAYKADLDAFSIFSQYGQRALKYINLTPFTAKVKELISSDLPDPKTGKLNWKLEDNLPQTYKFLSEWNNFVSHGYQSSLGRVVDRGINMLNKNLAFSLLSANLRSGLIQPTAIRNTYTEIGAKYTAEGIKMSIEDIYQGGKNREFAMKNSQVLDTRQMADVYDSVYDSIKKLRGSEIAQDIKAQPVAGTIRSLGAARDMLGSAGFKLLKIGDFETALATWNGSYKFATEKLGYSGKQAFNYADDVVTRTQASSLPGDLAPIQRSMLGRALTMFQTFVINDWNFLTRDVLGLKSGQGLTKDVAIKGARMIAATTILNMFLEDALGLNSPFPRPIKELVGQIREGENFENIASKVGLELVEPVPILSGTRYGRAPGGPILEMIGDAAEKLRGGAYANKKKGMITEIREEGLTSGNLADVFSHPVTKLGGVPGAAQFTKTFRAMERGESPWTAMTGWYDPNAREKESEKGANERLGGRLSR